MVLGQDIQQQIKDLQTETIDSNKIKLLLAIGKNYNRIQPDSAIHYYDLALSLAKSSDFLSYKAALLNQKGVALDFKGDESALSYFAKAKTAFETLKDTIGIGVVEINYGIHYYYRNQYDEALSYYLKAYDFFEKTQSLPLQSKVLNNIAILYRVQGNYERAIEIYRQSLAIKYQIKDSVGIATTFMNMGTAYEYLDNLEQMEVHFEKGLQQYQILKMEDGIAFCQVSMGQAFYNQKQYDKADKYFTAAQPYYQDKQHHRNYGYILQGLGAIANHQKEYQKTIDLLERKLENFQTLGRIDIAESMLKSLALAKNELGESNAAFKYLQAANALKDSLNKEKRIALSEEMQTKFNVEQKNKDLEIASLQLKQQRQQKQLFSFGLLLALLSLLLGAYLLYQKNKNNRLLAQKMPFSTNLCKRKMYWLKPLKSEWKIIWNLFPAYFIYKRNIWRMHLP